MRPSLLGWMPSQQAHDHALPTGADRSSSAGRMHNKLTGKLLHLSTGLRTSYRGTKASPKPEWSFGPIEVTEKTFPSLSKGPGIYPHACKHREDFPHKKTVSSLSASLFSMDLVANKRSFSFQQLFCERSGKKSFQIPIKILWMKSQVIMYHHWNQICK